MDVSLMKAHLSPERDLANSAAPRPPAETRGGVGPRLGAEGKEPWRKRGRFVVPVRPGRLDTHARGGRAIERLAPEREPVR
jgi:hypothetical protein